MRPDPFVLQAFPGAPGLGARQQHHIGTALLDVQDLRNIPIVSSAGVHPLSRYAKIDFAERTRAWIEVLGCVLIIVPFCLLLIVYGGEFALGAFATGERSRAGLGLPMRWIIMSTLPLGGLLLLLAGLSIAVRNGAFLLGRAPDVVHGSRTKAG